MRKSHLAALTVIDRSTGQIAADRHAQHQRRRKMAVGSPAHRRQLVAELHHRGPDVIEELDLGNWLQPNRRHADGVPHDCTLPADRRVVTRALRTELGLQGARLAVMPNTPPFPLTSERLPSRLQSATSSPNTITFSLRRISSRSVALSGVHHRSLDQPSGCSGGIGTPEPEAGLDFLGVKMQKRVFLGRGGSGLQDPMRIFEDFALPACRFIFLPSEVLIKPSLTRNFGKVTSGSRNASSSRSSLRSVSLFVSR